LLQCNNLPSSRTPRGKIEWNNLKIIQFVLTHFFFVIAIIGHQTPAAFLIMSSGLDKHDASSSKPFKYTHLDVAGSAGDIPHPPTGTPILSLCQLHLF
jgi:leucyl aminopeptidase